MPIKGFFPTGYQSLPAPHVQAFLFFPRLKVQGLVNFMIDTGADNTTLSLIDIERLNVDYRRLKRNSLVPVLGFGGERTCFREEALIVMRDEDARTYYLPTYIHIPKRGKNRIDREEQRKLLSVLGRDLINQCTLNTDFQQGVVELTPPEGARLESAMRRLL